MAKAETITGKELEKRVAEAYRAMGAWRVQHDVEIAREALSIADRCGYRLKQADCHNFLAQLAFDADNPEEARRHAETALERAACDGPDHRYEVAFQEAQRLLEEIGA